MRRLFIVVMLLVFASTWATAQLVNSSFSNFERFMIGDPYYNGDGWDPTFGTNRNGTNVKMVPAGDGTWICTNEFVPGQIVVYRFTCRTQGGSLIWEDLWGTIDYTNFQKRQGGVLNAEVISVNGYNFRKITIPLDATNYFTITNNFAEGPNLVDEPVAIPGTNYVILQWKYNSLGKQIDVVHGGYNVIYRSTNSASGPYVAIATQAGNLTRYTDSGLPQGRTNYYIISSHDTYEDTYPGARLHCYIYPDWAPFPLQGIAAPKIKVIFKVEAIDVDKVEADPRHIVYMTPIWADGRFYPYKIPGVFVKGYTLKKN